MDLQTIFERMRVHEQEISRYDGLISDMKAELKQLQEMRTEQFDSLRQLARGQQVLSFDEET